MEVEQNRRARGSLPRGDHLFDLVDPPRALLGGAMRGVDAHDIDPRLEQRVHRLDARRGGPQSGDDFSPANGAVQHRCPASEKSAV